MNPEYTFPEGLFEPIKGELRFAMMSHRLFRRHFLPKLSSEIPKKASRIKRRAGYRKLLSRLRSNGMHVVFPCHS